MDIILGKVRSFFGLGGADASHTFSEFRNPIWEDDDDDDDDDELYDRHRNFTNHNGDLPYEMVEIMKSFHNMLRQFGISENNNSMLNFDSLMDIPPEDNSTEALRNYYLKPGYLKTTSPQQKEDINLDGKISEKDLDGFFRPNKEPQNKEIIHFDGKGVPGHTFFETVITTSIRKPDGTVETKKIIKKGNNVTEEVTTTKTPSLNLPGSMPPGGESVYSLTDVLYESLINDFGAYWKNFY